MSYNITYETFKIQEGRKGKALSIYYAMNYFNCSMVELKKNCLKKLDLKKVKLTSVCSFYCNQHVFFLKASIN